MDTMKTINSMISANDTAKETAIENDIVEILNTIVAAETPGVCVFFCVCLCVLCVCVCVFWVCNGCILSKHISFMFQLTISRMHRK